MAQEIIFKTFRTYTHPYLYDRNTNSATVLSDEEYRELRQVERGEMPADQSSVVKRRQAQGLLKPSNVERIEHPETVMTEQYLGTRMRQLTLQVTQQCNLRCGYCVYSGSYVGQRTHSTKRMDLLTAKKAIDFFLTRNSEISDISIGFYGGEPLIEFDLIQECVDYAKSKVEGKRLSFTMTTNGTLLTDEVVAVLEKHDFHVNVSIDGSKEEHDANRRFADGTGSFDIVMENIRRIRERFPSFNKNVSFMTTVNPHLDLDCVLEYFHTEEVFSDKSIIFNNMSEVHLDGGLQYGKDYYGVRNFEYTKLLLALVGKLEFAYVSPLVSRAKGNIEQRQKSLLRHSALPPVCHFQSKHDQSHQ